MSRLARLHQIIAASDRHFTDHPPRTTSGSALPTQTYEQWGAGAIKSSALDPPAEESRPYTRRPFIRHSTIPRLLMGRHGGHDHEGLLVGPTVQTNQALQTLKTRSKRSRPSTLQTPSSNNGLHFYRCQ